MAKKEENAGSRSGFRISNGPVVALGQEKDHGGVEAAMNLPRVYGEKIFFAVARDPRTIFAYWNIDWPTIFAEGAPVDRQVHVRLYKSDGGEEKSAAVEPMSGSCYLPVSQAGANYRVEIGYYQPRDTWNSVAVLDDIAVPPDSVASNSRIDLATIPFHLRFQSLIDLLKARNSNALTEVISRLQSRALNEDDRALLRPEEWAILRAMGLSIDDVGSARRAFMDAAITEKLRKRSEGIPGSIPASPSGGFGGSSWP